MDNNLSSLLIQSISPTTFSSAHGMLKEVTQNFQAYFAGDFAIAYELVPETNGYPTYPPIYIDKNLNGTYKSELVDQISVQGTLADFLRHSRIYFEEDASSWIKLSDSNNVDVDFSQLIQIKGIKQFVFLPISYDDMKLAAIFILFRRKIDFNDDIQQYLSECLSLVGLRLAYLLHKENFATTRKRMAIAHSVYGKASALLNGQIDILQETIQETALDRISNLNVESQFESVRQSVFSVMRNLVISAADNVLVDLGQMTFAKALHTTAVALERAWPNSQQVKIEVPLIPVGFERFSLPFRELLYALVLELMGNAIHHGGPAPFIHVDLEIENGIVYIEVLDHGNGFNLDTTQFSQYGLGFWEEYLPNYLNGSFHVSSQDGYGTVVRTRIPTLY